MLGGNFTNAPANHTDRHKEPALGEGTKPKEQGLRRPLGVFALRGVLAGGVGARKAPLEPISSQEDPGAKPRKERGRPGSQSDGSRRSILKAKDIACTAFGGSRLSRERPAPRRRSDGGGLEPLLNTLGGKTLGSEELVVQLTELEVNNGIPRGTRPLYATQCL